MKLMTQALVNRMPKLYQTEHEPLTEKIALAKFFHPLSSWTWYAIEYDGEDLCWGLVDGHEAEFGYFSLSELAEAFNSKGLPIERDRHFQPTKVKDLAAFGKGGTVV